MTDGSLLLALAGLFQPWPLLALAVGVAIGLVNGALPGTGLAGLFIVLGLAYGMDPVIAIPLAIGVIVPMAITDVIPAVLLAVPGSGSTQAIVLDGHELAKQGKAEMTLAATYAASFLGTLIGVVVLLLTVPTSRTLIQQLGSPEFLLVGLLGVAVVGVLSSGNMLKGLIAGVLGMLIATIGLDSAYGMSRSTFGSTYLVFGVDTLVFILGMFAIPEVADFVAKGRAIGDMNRTTKVKHAEGQRRAGLRAMWTHRRLVAKTGVMGSVIGVLPGIGLSAVDWLTYGYARATEPGAKKTFGKGDIRGVLAPAGADNACLAGSFVPMLALGIPGGVTTAVLMGFLLVLGIQPGPQMMTNHMDIVYLIIISVAVAAVLATGAAFMLSRQIAKIALVPPNILMPAVVSFLALAAYQATNTLGDLVALFGFALLGLFMKRHGWPRAPMIIGFVLAPVVENYWRLTMQAYGWGIFDRVGVWVILCIAATLVFYVLRLQRRTALESAEADEHVDSSGGRA